MSDAVEIADTAPPDWDSYTVDSPGGHVLQSVAWAEHWRQAGRRPLFLTTGDDRVLALVRPWPWLPGGAAYLSRGPVPNAGGEALGRTLAAVTAALDRRGIDVIAVDPEVAEADQAWAAALDRGGYHPIEEIQPSRHVLMLPLAGVDEAAALARVTKATRQRIRQADRQSVVLRFDGRQDERSGVEDDGNEFRRPDEPADAAFRRFYGWLVATGERRGFHLGPLAHYTGWWARALAAGHLVYLESRDRETGEPVGGLILYRHGRRLSTVHSADLPATRRSHPGTMHLLRWRAVQLAIREGRDQLDMGGVDLPGARREPQPGESMYGLYEHKRSFGAEWLALRGAHERVKRPGRYLAGRILARARAFAPGR